MRRYVFYIIYNVIYQIFSFWLLLLLGAYYNGVLIPPSLKSITEFILSIILIVEAALLILFIYAINQLILSDTEEKSIRISIANRTAKINIIASLCFLVLLILGILRG